MIPRYSRPELARNWSEDTKLQLWLDVEILACEAQAKLGLVPAADLARIKRRAKFSLDRTREIEDQVHHDVIAFLTNVAEHVGPSARFIHLGMTSSDVLDTALAVQCARSCDVILKGVDGLRKVLKRRAREHRRTVMIGRSHGIHAEPTTFGLKLALWYDEMARNRDRLEAMRERIAVGQISGAVGTFANIDPSVEAYVCKKLGLTPAPASTQIIQRDRHAEFVQVLALVAASLEKFATEIRNLQRTDIHEVEEPFTSTQKGSSAMPHKRNPIRCEQIAGLARVVRGNAVAALENVALWHERDITHSSVERVILPDSAILVDYVLHRFTQVMDKLVVYPDNMLANLERTRGTIFSQRVLLALAEAGMSREDAYRLVQRHAMKTVQNGADFKTLLRRDKTVGKRLGPGDLDALFDLDYHLEHVDAILRRTGVLAPARKSRGAGSRKGKATAKK